MKTLLVFSTAVVLAFATLLACNAGDNAETLSKSTESTAGTKGTIHTLTSVSKAPGAGMMTDFSWKDGDRTVSLSQIGKGKVVFLNFWGTWCPPCRREIPDIVEISNEMKNVVVVGVALERGGTDKLADFIDKNNIPYVNIVGQNEELGKLMQAYGGISAVPTTFIIADGKIVSTIVGSRNKAAFMEEIKKAM